MKTDLQIQTTFSDGRDTPTEIITLAKKAGVNFLAITDHDTTDGTEEAEKAAAHTKIKVIRGVEASATYNDARFHILGYNVDPANTALQKSLEEVRAELKSYLIGIIPWMNKILKKADLKTVSQEAYKDLPQKYYRGPGLALFLQEQGVFSHMSEAFEYFDDLPKLILKKSVKEVVGAIHGAGGVAVLSHPLGKKRSLRAVEKNKAGQEKILKQFVAYGLDGIECYTPSHTKADNKLVKNWAKKFHLHITAGSDWHGTIAQVGANRARDLPGYFDDFGGLEVPVDDVQSMIDWLF